MPTLSLGLRAQHKSGADVGLFVDSAVDVAKVAADMILLKQDLHVLHAGVLEGDEINRGYFDALVELIAQLK